jgi:hypothetical protein
MGTSKCAQCDAQRRNCVSPSRFAAIDTLASLFSRALRAASAAFSASSSSAKPLLGALTMNMKHVLLRVGHVSHRARAAGVQRFRAVDLEIGNGATCVNFPYWRYRYRFSPRAPAMETKEPAVRPETRGAEDPAERRAARPAQIRAALAGARRAEPLEREDRQRVAWGALQRAALAEAAEHRPVELAARQRAALAAPRDRRPVRVALEVRAALGDPQAGRAEAQERARRTAAPRVQAEPTRIQA